MADRDSGGAARPSGEVRAERVPTGYTAPRSRHVKYGGTIATARLTPDGFSVSVHGQFRFGGRSGSRSVDVDAGSPEVKAVKDALEALAASYEDAAQDAGMGAGYLAREIAERAGEDLGEDGGSDDE